MPANYGRLLADGVGAWLQYEHACGHIELFSERYLSHAIGNILAGQSGIRARAEFPHPVLAPITSGRGRRPAIDFVVCDPYPTVRIAVESKWIGTTEPTVNEILWDLIRLELLAHQSNTSAFFLLAGQRRDLDAYFRKTAFFDASTDINRRPLLAYDRGGNHSVTIGPVDHMRTPFLEEFFERYSDLPFPRKIRTTRTEPFPAVQTTSGFQVYVWRVRPMGTRSTMTGSEMLTWYPRPKSTRAEVDAILALREASLQPQPAEASHRASASR